MKAFKIFLFILFFLPLPSQAVGISVQPSSIDLLSPDVVEKKLSVKNISKEPIVVHIYVDDFSDNINIEPNEFELLPEQVTSVRISGDFSNFSAGTQKTNISVLSKALDKKSFNAISGIKIPLSIYINKDYFQWSGPAVFVVVFLGGLIIFYLFRVFVRIFSKQKKKGHWFSINLLVHHKKKSWYKWR
ncbi:MAG: hypothetical protein WCV71_03325 [Patescibacteria group bacterium]|jgi:hypothetical protein